MDQNAITEALKEALRVVLLALIPLLILGTQEGFTFDYQAMAVVGVLAFLRFLDKLLHEYGKASGNEKWIKGLTRF